MTITRYECVLQLHRVMKAEPPWLGKLLLVLRAFTQRTLPFFRGAGAGAVGHCPSRGANQVEGRYFMQFG